MFLFLARPVGLRVADQGAHDMRQRAPIGVGEIFESFAVGVVEADHERLSFGGVCHVAQDIKKIAAVNGAR